MTSTHSERERERVTLEKKRGHSTLFFLPIEDEDDVERTSLDTSYPDRDLVRHVHIHKIRRIIKSTSCGGRTESASRNKHAQVE